MDGGLESRCVGRVYGADCAVAWHHPHRTHDFVYTGLFKMIVEVLTTCHTQYI